MPFDPPTAATRRTRFAALSLMLVATAGCGLGETSAALAAPEQRPSDGLLTDAELQAVVDAQIERAWEPLVAYLGHERPAVRARASLALASVQAYQAVPALVVLLDDPDAAVRRDAAFALGQSAQEAAAEPIFEALARESDPHVRHRLIEALGKLGFDQVLQGLVDLEVEGADEVDRLLAMARLGAVQGRVSDASRNALLARIDDADPAIRFVSAYFFGRYGDYGAWAPRVARVRDVLDSYRGGDPAAIHLVKALGGLKDPADRERLSRFASSAPDWRVRAEAMAGLAGRELDDATRDVLLAGLNDVSIHVAVSAALTLAGSTHLPSVMGRMESWVQNNPERWQVAGPLLQSLARQDHQEFVIAWFDGLAADDEVRRDIGLRALGLLRGPEALSRLREAATSDSDRIAAAAIIGLRQRWGADEADPRTHATHFEIFSTALTSGRVQAVSVAAPVLAQPAFSTFGNTQVLLDAMAAARLPDDLAIVQTILATLGQTGDPAVEGVMREALHHPYAPVRRTAARALGQHFGEEVEVPEGGLEAPGEAGAGAGPDPSRIDWDYLAGLGTLPKLVLETEKGRLVLQLSTEEAPHTVQTLARLAEEGRFDGTPFHRVVPNFVIQGGDVGSGDGRGGPGFSITTEITGIPYGRGVAGMASVGKDTEGSQFFLVHSPQPHLDGQYTAFGWLLEGAEVLDGVAQGDLLLSARIEPGG